ALLALVTSTFRTRAAQQAEIVALRHQIAALQQSAPRRLRLRQSDRLLWIWLSRFWPAWRHWLRILKPDTVLRWHRTAFARYWTRKSRRRPGRPSLAAEAMGATIPDGENRRCVNLSPWDRVQCRMGIECRLGKHKTRRCGDGRNRN